MTARAQSVTRTRELGLMLQERRRLHDIGPLDTIDVSASVAAGVAGFSLWTTAGKNWASVRMPVHAPLSLEMLDELAEHLGPYPTREEASEAALRRLLACVALLSEASPRRMTRRRRG